MSRPFPHAPFQTQLSRVFIVTIYLSAPGVRETGNWVLGLIFRVKLGNQYHTR